MRKALLVFFMASIVAVTGCERGSKPNPKPEKTHIVAPGAVVQICVDPVSQTRWKDELCDQNPKEYRWAYVRDRPPFKKELPAVRELLEMGRADWAAPSRDVPLERIPAAGAYFPG
jgi:hypothetical protein